MFGPALWKKQFNYWPQWPCPNCYSVSLALKKDSLTTLETGPSKRDHSIEAWEPDFTVNRFVALLVCGNPSCGEVVAVCGTSGLERDEYYDQDGEAQLDYESVYSPKFFEPAIPVFAIPKACPENVAEQLTAAFGLIWSDAAGCANRLRTGIEALLDHQGIAKTAISSKKERVRLNLHSRIEKFQAKNSEASNYLMAIKWIGNFGSHQNLDALSTEDLLNGFELFEAAVDLLYVNKAQRYKRLAARISKRKGRPPTKKKATS